MEEHAALVAHGPAWYDRLAGMQRGYYFPWRSRIAPGNGEDAYVALVDQHLAPDEDVLDVGCGHGEVALAIAARCRRVLAYDRVAPYVELARSAARERGVTNVDFICADSSADANDGAPRIPAEPRSFDLLISRRGPLHWIEDARRVARPGAVLIQLNPLEGAVPPWNGELPEMFRFRERPWAAMPASVERRLDLVGLELHSSWTFDVPEYLPDPEQLYVMLAWGYTPEEVPSLEEVRTVLQGIFDRYAGPAGLVVRHRRFLWKAVVEDAKRKT